jgi:hypothetical protein
MLIWLEFNGAFRSASPSGCQRTRVDFLEFLHWLIPIGRVFNCKNAVPFGDGIPATGLNLSLRRVQDTEGGSAIGPDQHQGVLAFWNTGEFLLHIRCRVYRVTVHFGDDVTAPQSCVIG